MQRFLLGLAVLALLCTNVFQSQAAPGDTTWVNSHDSTQMTYYGIFDAPAAFPDGSLSYRRINMHFTVGRYACPGYNPQTAGEGAGSSGWCGDWDYDVHAYALTPAGDTFEIGRLITPYANSYYNAAATPANWKRDYIFDVTDYYPILKNDATIRILYSGYSGGFTGTVRFEMIEGEREHDVLGIQRAWHGSVGFGDAAAVESFLTPLAVTPPAGTVDSRLAFTITGHGANADYCAEFCPKDYYVHWDGMPIDTQLIWRNDCGANELYPQSGTWIYERGNWCPGASVKTFHHPLPATTGLLDVNLQDYSAGGGASYNIESAVFFYGPKNKTVDAGLEDILAPTDHPDHFREGNSCSQPIVRVKNFGATPITAMHLSYGIGGISAEYNWTGSIPTDTMQDVALPAPVGMSGLVGTNEFVAKITSVNGQPLDEDTLNNRMSAMATAPVKWSDTLRLRMRTNMATVTNLAGQTVSETSYRVYDAAGNVVHERVNLAPSTTYADTLYLEPNACYRIVVTDLGCDGLSWWANTAAGAGWFRAHAAWSPVQLPIARYRDADFGCGFTQWFTTAAANPAGVAPVAPAASRLQAWPNPAQDVLNVNLEDLDQAGVLELRDALGRLAVSRQTAPNAQATMSIAQQPAGVYTLTWRSADGRTPAMVTRVVIAR